MSKEDICICQQHHPNDITRHQVIIILCQNNIMKFNRNYQIFGIITKFSKWRYSFDWIFKYLAAIVPEETLILRIHITCNKTDTVNDIKTQPLKNIRTWNKHMNMISIRSLSVSFNITKVSIEKSNNPIMSL